MGNIKESAEAYVPPETDNITELASINVSEEVKHGKFNEGTADEYESDYIEIKDQKYRMPKSVLKQLQAILKEKKDLKKFKVVKQGTGFTTSYTVVTLD